MIARIWHGEVRPEKGRYYPEDEELPLDFGPTVGHYEVVVGT